MADMRTTLQGMNLPKTLPVGTADAGSMITTTLATGSDYVMANVHPWFGGVPIDEAAGWVYSYTSNQEPSSASLATNKPQIYIAETGWPTGANETQFATYQAAVAGVPELNTFLDTYICQANQNITASDAYSSYFFFEGACTVGSRAADGDLHTDMPHPFQPLTSHGSPSTAGEFALDAVSVCSLLIVLPPVQRRGTLGSLQLRQDAQRRPRHSRLRSPLIQATLPNNISPRLSWSPCMLDFSVCNPRLARWRGCLRRTHAGMPIARAYT